MNSTHVNKNQKKTSWVVLLTAATMVVEIFFGMRTGSMALLADGIHIGSHVLAIGISLVAYVLVKKAKTSKRFTGDENKILSLSGYTSGIILLLFAFIILAEAFERMVNPIEISYKEAILIATLGFVVNVLSALLLHHDHEHSDHNIKAAYLHVIADALTSVGAIIGLIVAMIWNIFYIDTIAAIVSSIIIIKWSVGLLKDTGSALIKN